MSNADRDLDLLASEEEGAAGHSATEGRPSLVTERDGDLQSLIAAVTTMSQKLDSIDCRSKANAKALKQPQKPKSRSEPPRKKIRKFPIRDTVSPDEDDDADDDLDDDQDDVNEDDDDLAGIFGSSES